MDDKNVRMLLTGALAVVLAAGCGSSDKPIPAPPAGQGFQIATASFPVRSGEETQRCFFWAVPGTPGEKVYVNRIQSFLNTGSHHFNIYRPGIIRALNGKPGDQVPDGECWNGSNFGDWEIIYNSQGSWDFKTPPGVAFPLVAGEVLMTQVHFVNTTTQKTPTDGRGVFNVYTVDKSQVQNIMGNVRLQNVDVRVCAGDKNKSFTVRCPFADLGPVTIVAATGHFHSRGTDFKIQQMDPTGTIGSTFFEFTDYAEPRLDAGFNIKTEKGGGFLATCTYSFPTAPGACGDPDVDCCYVHGNHVETQEHCAGYVYYYPKENASNPETACGGI